MTTPYNYNVASRPPAIPLSPRRRQHAVQPPNLLTTSLGNARNAGLGVGGVSQTPISTTSLSSPFSASAYPQSPNPASPGSAMRGTSPLTFRSNTGSSAAYNPQQWGPLNNDASVSNTRLTNSHSSRAPALAPRLVGPDGMANRPTRNKVTNENFTEPVASPPPPYSPRRDGESQDSDQRPPSIVSPSDTTSPGTESNYGTPVSAATTLSPDFVSRYPQGPSPVRRHQATPSDSPNASAGPVFPPPPPQASGQRIRSASKNHADRLLSTLTSRGKSPNTASPTNAIDVLQDTTAQLLTQSPEAANSSSSIRAPAARRAASTGALGLAGGFSRSASHSPSPTTWTPGMPLPPPPPGPPPSAARSQSLDRPLESPSNCSAPTLPLRARRPPGTGTALETVPPTPADWTEEDASNVHGPLSPRTKGPSPLHIDTGSILYRRRAEADYPQTTTGASPAHMRRDSSTGGLFRSPAVRNRSAKGIRERRSESRNGKGRAIDDSAISPESAAPWADDADTVRPMDLVLPAPQSKEFRQRMLHKSTPKSAQSIRSLDGALNSAEFKSLSGKSVSFAASHTSPPPESSRSHRFSASISAQEIDSFSNGAGAPMPSPKAVPMPVSHGMRDSPKRLSLIVPPTLDQRPVSHILHMPNSDDSMQVPLTPATKLAQEPLADLIGPETPRAFAGRAIERHRLFAEREAAAANDSERLDLFVQYISAESRIRREQYASVFEDEGIDIDDLTQGLFGQHTTNESFHESLQNLSGAGTSKRTSIASSALIDSSSQGGSSPVSRKHESPSSATTNSSVQHRPESGWMKDYVPSLSPIASMSIVTGQDEMDSRGRAPSRWWEDQSRSGEAASGDAFNVLERSKRESKYMGVPLEARNSPAVHENAQSSTTRDGRWQTQGGSQAPSYGPDEYPPEKVGWPEEGSSITPNRSATPSTAPYAPDPRRLDISRLVTLPPPYPRHHPAVNNGHPDLADMRAVVRCLNENEEAEAIRESYNSQMLSKRQRADSWCKHQRSIHSQDVDFRLEHGEMSQADFEEADRDLEAKIMQSEKDVLQTDFDLFQSSVLTPLHSICTERINLANSSLDMLSGQLFSDAQSRSPNLPQEEGDEQPELLEKLTQLKWLFEARETLHRRIYDLLSERNDKYKAIVLLPYEQSQNHGKRTEAESFFAKDAQERRIAFERAVCSRAQAFLTVIENNVTRGVEVQLSAFWDIAPSLLEILHKIPGHLEGFEIQIPPSEYDENPSYYEHPMQYLYSLLGHAEKSTYQFIESQINLLCLLHEIRSHTLIARCRVDAHSSDASWTAGEEQRRGEMKLTEDLKEKVGVIEGQWEDALGRDLTEAREKVREYLLEKGGWDDEGEEV